jgi:hypothetical protein
METLILGWYVLVESGSVVMLTVFGALMYVGTLLSPLIGTLGDRIGLRRLLTVMRLVYALLACTVLAGGWPQPADAQPQASTASAYREPVPELRAIVDAPRPPQMSLSPRRDLIAMRQVPDLPGIDMVAQPELKLAGLRLHPRVPSPLLHRRPVTHLRCLRPRGGGRRGRV